MDLRTMLVLCLAGAACCSSIQDPYIHDHEEDQLAVESAEQRSVVKAPPHLLRQLTAAAASKPADQPGQVQPEKNKGEQEVVEADESDDTVVVEAAAVPGGFQGSAELSGLVRRPQFQAPSGLTQYLSLLAGLQNPWTPYSSPVILLQPIIVPVPTEGLQSSEGLLGAGSAPAASRLPYYGAAARYRQPTPLSLYHLLSLGQGYVLY